MTALSHQRLAELTKEVEKISRVVGKFMRDERAVFNRKKVEHKGQSGLVSYVDQQAEKQFVDALFEIFPEAGFIAEEGTGSKIEGGYNWVIDPLDGTTNFVHNIPFYSSSVALEYRGTVLLGVIYDPSHDEMYAAHAGGITTLNGVPVKVSKATRMSDMLMVTGFPYDHSGLLQANLDTIKDLTLHSRGIRRLGSAALDLCYVACGRFDGMYEYGLNPWDVAAGICLVAQAGGKVDDFEGKGNPLFGEQLLVGSPAAFDLLLPIVRKNFEK